MIAACNNIDDTPVVKWKKQFPAMKERVEMEIERLKNEKIYYRSSEFRVGYPHSTVVMKKDGSIPIFGDYKITLNKISNYPIPKIEDSYSTL